MTEQVRAGMKRIESVGATGETVRENVRRLREARGWSFAALARQTAHVGREIPSLGLRRIEEGARRVDVDDLMALAVALGTSPLQLLLPRTRDMAPVRATAIEGLLASELRRWAIGNGTGLSADERLNYWRRQEISTRVTQEAKEDAIAANETLLRTAVEGGDTAEVDRLAGAIEQYRRGLEHATHQREEIRSRMADLWAEVERETKDGQVENGDV